MIGMLSTSLAGWRAASVASFCLLATAIILGGASRQNELRVAIIELVALPALALALVSIASRDQLERHRYSLAILAAIALVPVLQIMPLPASIWTGLPGRSQLLTALEISGLQAGFGTISLTPDQTWQAFLALIPPVAMFVGVLTSNAKFRQRVVQVLVGFTLLAILLGTAQLASQGTQLYLWETTDAGNAVGFFANRNHMATLVLTSLPLAVVTGVRPLRRGGSRLLLWLSMVYIGLAIVALGVIRSRTGIILVGPVLALSLFAGWVAIERTRAKPLILTIAASALIALAAVAFFALGPILSRFDSDGVREGRFENWPIVLNAASDYLPVGTGLGSFDPVFRSIEPLERLDATFFNQAHNDYLEMWLETGWLGAGLLVAFMVWFIRRSAAAWRAGASTERDIQRAASIAIGVILVHSMVDYPLRTLTVATLFALLCGLLEFAGRPDDELQMQRSRLRRRRNHNA